MSKNQQTIHLPTGLCTEEWNEKARELEIGINRSSRTTWRGCEPGADRFTEPRDGSLLRRLRTDFLVQQGRGGVDDRAAAGVYLFPHLSLGSGPACPPADRAGPSRKCWRIRSYAA